MLSRPRRNRKTEAIRSLCQETLLSPSNFIVPFFVTEGSNQKIALPSLPNIYKYSKDLLVKEAAELHKKGIPAIILFPTDQKKDSTGSSAFDENNLILATVKLIKQEIPSLTVICDIALDPYTDHGHDGLIGIHGEVLNDPTVELLQNLAVLYAEVGADFVAPSDMMDGRVEAIRKKLDLEGHTDTGILSYTAKYASHLYAPFRETLKSAPAIGDKKGYQMDPRNSMEAIREALLDQTEGADLLMIKPALFYLDIIAKIKQVTYLPICAYHVSGEYAMVMAAHEKGYLDCSKVFLESLISIKRAGANCIISYAIPHILSFL